MTVDIQQKLSFWICEDLNACEDLENFVGFSFSKKISFFFSNFSELNSERERERERLKNEKQSSRDSERSGTLTKCN